MADEGIALARVKQRSAAQEPRREVVKREMAEDGEWRALRTRLSRTTRVLTTMSRAEYPEGSPPLFP